MNVAVGVGACNVEAPDALSGLCNWEETRQRISRGWEKHILEIDCPDWCWDDDQVYAEVAGGRVAVFHDATIYNCCPDPFEYEISVEGDFIRVREIEVLSNPCYCICCFNLAMTIEDVPAGDYTLEFTWFDYETDDWLARSLEISVPDEGQAAFPALGDTHSSGCIEPQSVPDEPNPGDQEEVSPTWGRIKHFFD